MDLAGLDHLIDGLDGALERALDTAAARALAVARRAAGGGPLARSLRIQRRGALERELVSDDPGAVFAEKGRGPAEAHGKVLRFVVAGQVVYARRVGPAKPHPFLAPAAAELEAHAAALVEQAIAELAR